MKRELDTADRKIVELLQEDARLPLKSIADKVSLTSPTVSARIDRLEKDGVITGYRASVNPEVFDYRIKAFINLEVEPVRKKEFYPYITDCPNVIECNCVTGDYSMLMEVVFHTTSELDQFIGQLQHFGRTKTQIVFSTSVEHRGIPLGDTRILTCSWSRRIGLGAGRRKRLIFCGLSDILKRVTKTGIPLGGRREKTRSEKQIKDG